MAGGKQSEDAAKDQVHIQDLASCQNWKAVVDLLESAKKQFGARPSADAQFLANFRPVLGVFCPRHNFDRDSVQKRAVDYFGDSARNAFHAQEESRLFNGFEMACEFSFGTGWRDHSQELWSRHLLQEIDLLGHAPELLGNHAETLQNALSKGDHTFFERINHRLRKRSEAYANFVNSKQSSEALPDLDIRAEICRYWTSPDFPLWLMMDVGIKQSLRYLTGGGHLNDRALQQRIFRMDLKRYSRRPIQSAEVRRAAGNSRLHFSGYKFADYIVEEMEGVPIAKGYGETGLWTAGPLQ